MESMLNNKHFYIIICFILYLFKKFPDHYRTPCKWDCIKNFFFFLMKNDLKEKNGATAGDFIIII